MMGSAGKNKEKILILIDNRVQREAATLTSEGYQVLVICPRYPGESKYNIHNEVQIYRYNKWKFAGHISEYLSSLIKGGWLSLRAWKWNGGFDCIQACNPPDLWFIIAALFKKIVGIKFVFDHHDVCSAVRRKTSFTE